MPTLEELRERKAQREEAASKEKAARELAVLELEERCLEECGGPRGVAFEIIDVSGEPLIAVKPGPAVLFKSLQESKAGLDDLQRFVTACLVTPDKTAFGELVQRRAGVIVRCADALVTLYRGDAIAQGKGF